MGIMYQSGKEDSSGGGVEVADKEEPVVAQDSLVGPFLTLHPHSPFSTLTSSDHALGCPPPPPQEARHPSSTP